MACKPGTARILSKNGWLQEIPRSVPVTRRSEKVATHPKDRGDILPAEFTRLVRVHAWLEDVCAVCNTNYTHAPGSACNARGSTGG